LIDELLSDLRTEIEDLGEDVRNCPNSSLKTVEDQLIKAANTLFDGRQKALDETCLAKRRVLFDEQREGSDR